MTHNKKNAILRPAKQSENKIPVIFIINFKNRNKGAIIYCKENTGLPANIGPGYSLK